MNNIHTTKRTWKAPFGGLLLAITMFFGIAQTAKAQIAAYSFAQTSGTYAPITGGTVLGTAANDDQVFVIPAGTGGLSGTPGVGLPIGFNFTFNGTVCTIFGASANGWITVGNGTSIQVGNNANDYTPLSAGTTGFTNVIAAFATDLVSQTTGEMRYQTIGTTPNRTLVVQWKDYSSYAGGPVAGDAFNYQIRLNETSNTTSIVYGTNLRTATTNATGQVGLRGIATTDFNNRTTATSWANNVAGTVNTATCPLSATILPAAGLTFTWTPSLACTGTPAAGTANASATSVCAGANFALSLTGSTVATGITYQWQSSGTFTGTYLPISGATSSTLTTSATATTFYRCVVSCPNPAPGSSSTSTVVSVTINNPTYATVPYTQGFESAWLTTCVTAPLGQDTPDASWRMTAGADNDASWRADNTTTVLSGWSSVFGAYTPTGANASARSARFHSYNVFPAGTQSFLDLYINLSSAGAKQLSFDYITPSPGIDQLEVLLSTDGGATFTALTTTPAMAAPATAVTVWTNVTASITSLSATAVIRFRATGDNGNFDIGLDNVSVTVATAPVCTAVVVTPASGAVTFTNGTLITPIALSASGGPAGAATYAYAVTAGALPAGLTLTGASISGTPTATGTGTFTVTATSTPGTCTGTAVYTFTVNAATTCTPVVVTPASGAVAFTNGTLITPIALSASGGPAGAATYAYAVTAGALPAGLTLTGASISGTPTATGTGTFTVTATSTPGTCTGTAVYTFTVNAATTCTPVVVTPASGAVAFTNGTLITPIALSASGGPAGAATYAYAVTAGALPAGLTLTGASISGTPTVTGTGTFTITATSTPGTCTGTAVYTFTVNAAGCTTVVVTPASGAVSFTNGTAITPIALSATGGATGATYAYAVTAGALPAGLTLTGASISGTPTATGTGSFTVTATSTPGTCTGTATYTFTVNVATACSGVVITLTPATLPNATVGTAYSQALTATGGTAPYTFTTTGVLPAGLALSSAGVLTGTPTVASTSVTFVVTATATGGCTGGGSRSLVINPNPATAIDNALSNLVKVSPNPSSNDFNVDFGGLNMNKATVRVYDAQGKNVFSADVKSNLMTISLDKLATGIYLMEVETSKGRILKRLAKQ